MVLNGLLEINGLADKAVPLLRSLDKLPKIGHEKVAEEMVKEAGVTARTRRRGAETRRNDRHQRGDSWTGSTRSLRPSPNDRAAEGIRRLHELLAVAESGGRAGGPHQDRPEHLPAGWTTTTGTIYETFLYDLPGIGSVCSGGRYDNLASKYTKQVLPGVGASLGVDRLIAAMEELKHPLLTGQTTPAQVLVVNFDEGRDWAITSALPAYFARLV